MTVSNVSCCVRVINRTCRLFLHRWPFNRLAVECHKRQVHCVCANEQHQASVYPVVVAIIICMRLLRVCSHLVATAGYKSMQPAVATCAMNADGSVGWVLQNTTALVSCKKGKWLALIAYTILHVLWMGCVSTRCLDTLSNRMLIVTHMSAVHLACQCSACLQVAVLHSLTHR